MACCSALGVGFLIRSVSLVAACVALFALPASAHAAFPGANGKIAFERVTDCPTVTVAACLFTANADGTGEVSLDWCATTTWFICGPSWSPGGSKIAYSKEVGWNDNQEVPCCHDVFTMNADGTGRTNVTNENQGSFGPDNAAPSWSPDGTKITFTKDSRRTTTGGEAAIYVVNADGTGETRLAPGSFPSWSPDGSRIAFVRETTPCCPEFNEVYIMNADGSGLTNLTNNPADDRHPSWSPDGGTIVFATNRDGRFEIYTIRPNGTQVTRITNNAADGGVAGNPTFSPDGMKIAFGGAPCSSCSQGIYTMNLDGSDQTLIIGDYAAGPDWQPIPGPQRNNYKNAAQFCKAERDFLADSAFRQKYGGSNAYGKCVSQTH